MATADQQAAAAALLGYYNWSTAQLRAQLVAFIQRLWTSLGIYRNTEMATFTRQLGPILQGAERQMSALTTGYLNQLASIYQAPPIRPVVVPLEDVTGPATRNGTAPADVYGRPFHQVWREIHHGVPPQTAIDHGLQRAEKAVQTDLQRTKILTAHQVMRDDQRVVGYRRVLQGAHSCGLCIVASTRRYHRAELMPVHPGCDCNFAAVYGDHDPGEVLDLELLQDVHAAIEAAFPGVSNPSAASYQHLIVTHEHGELGPVLARAGQRFTGPNDLG